MRRRHRYKLTAGAIAAVAALTLPSAAAASATQESIVEPGPSLLTNTGPTLQQLRLLGVNTIRLFMHWQAIAPDPTSRTRPPHFNGASPAAYPARNWASWDAIVRGAQQYGIKVDLDLGGRAPLWAMPAGTKKFGQGSAYPSPSEYTGFVEAVSKRYSGHYRPPHASTPLPRVSFWSVWNEPDYISSLQPQSSGPKLETPIVGETYRNLVDAAWKGLHATGHGSDAFVWGELAPRYTGLLRGLAPLVVLRAMYCVDAHYRPLRAAAATALGCPTTSAGSRSFRFQHPALFGATGVSVHPYSRWYPPDEERYPNCGDCTSLGDIGHLTTGLDRLQRVYGSHKRFPIYSTEYGYQTSPPKLSPDPTSHDLFVSPSTAAAYINWAEYISYRNPRLVSYDQYLLDDPARPTPANDFGSFASGLETWDGHQKPDYAAFRLPLYLPQTTAASSGQNLEVWGDARVAHYAEQDTGTPQQVYVQFQPVSSGTWANVEPVTITNPEGYFDVEVPFTESGNVRIAYQYPVTDPMLPDLAGVTVVSRTIPITVH